MQALYEAIAEDYIHLGSKPAIHKAILRDPSIKLCKSSLLGHLLVTKHKGANGLL
jgi:hypothetical protein